jgi:[acyl-carrier-protein] S-malonyltransferase
MTRYGFIFPGQGAQYVGMGLEFAENFAVAKDTFEEADEILGRSLSRIVFAGPDSLLTATHNSQVGIFVTSVAILRVVEQHVSPDICGGLSLGEWTAVVASGRLTFEEALPLVQLRGSLMSRACEENKGAMAAILGLDDLEELVASVEDLWVANLNCPGQVVISGSEEGVARGIELAKERGAKRAIPLQVHGAFHSGLMSEARDEFAPAVQQAPFKASDVPLAMNVIGGLAPSEDVIAENLIAQVTDPVRWEGCVRAMSEVDCFLEIGCGKVLAGFNKRIGVNAPTVTIERVEDLEKVLDVVQG